MLSTRHKHLLNLYIDALAEIAEPGEPLTEKKKEQAKERKDLASEHASSHKRDQREIDKDEAHANMALETLRQTKSDEDIVKSLVAYTKHPFTGSVEHDQAWFSSLNKAEKQTVLRAVQAGWQAAFAAASDADGQRLPDLEADGPEGEYEALKAEGAVNSEQ